MKRVHINITMTDIDRSVGFCTTHYSEDSGPESGSAGKLTADERAA